MGFLPIMIVVGGASLLFILTVRIYLAQRNKTLEELELQMSAAAQSLRFGQLYGESTHPSGFFPSLKMDKKNSFDQTLLAQFTQAHKNYQLEVRAYNKLVKKRPYSFVAKIFGFRVRPQLA
ncbi:hypothetical protein A3SI_11139 [Nitritalea halalkaliphila LW7]|uniref:LemA family protein n=1 Tax=Nitritalea halalkaliphila LW7 TaxID=1189621 RepID=I5C2X3_9BACT|nr:hypothetical protein [Nitritalea halalkaliphila]EIM76175.1 hypothetical protein A3SI_11139 [Nitritalea halalkaliphila LW7]